MNISKSVGIITTAIPIVGILIGGITFGVNFKTDVDIIKEDIANQKAINEAIPAPYDDTLVWNTLDNIIIPDIYDDSYLNERIQDLAIENTELRAELDTFNIQIPEMYDDSYLDERVQNLALQVTELRTELDNLEIQDMELFDDSDLRGRLAELEGQLSALSSIDMTSDDGSVDISPLVISIATVEGSITSLRSSIDSIKGDIRTIKSDITSVERIANTAKTTADSAKTSSGGSRTVENDYDDSDLRTRISAVERQVNSIPTTSSGTTIQRVENPFDDASLRADISSLQTAIAVIQASGGESYDDADLRDRIDDIRWELDNIDIPTAATPTDTTWLEDLMYDIKHELSLRIDELELVSTSNTGSNDVYAEIWEVDDLRNEILYLQEQVWELQTLVANSSSTSTQSNNSPPATSTTSGRSWDGSYTEPYCIYIDHVDNNGNHTYTGDYWMDGY